MKKIHVLFFTILFTAFSQAQVSKIINVVTPGTLSTLLTTTEKSTVTNLTVTGKIDTRDFVTLRDYMPLLTTLDLTAVDIITYKGTDGTAGIGAGGTSIEYLANEIPEYSFYHSTKRIGSHTIQSVKFPDSATKLCDMTFNDCTALTSVTFGLNFTTLAFMFYINSKLIEINVNPLNKWYSAVDGVLFNKDKTALYVYPQATTGSYTIPSTVNSISNFSFSRCTGLTSITIPNSVTSIGHYAFEKCSGLSSIVIPISLITIGNDAFTYCTGIKGNIIIPNTITAFGGQVFGHCSSLNSVTISFGLDSIPDYTFEGCSSLSNISIPNSISKIGNAAFSGCNSLISVSMPNSVVSLGHQAFYTCSGLTNINIPNTISKIENGTFGFCSGLTSLTIPNSVTTICDGAFSSCSGLTSITIGSSTDSIGLNAFKNCGKLKTIYSLNSLPPKRIKKYFSYLPSVTDVFVPTDAAVNLYKANLNWIGTFPGDIIKKGVLGAPIVSISTISTISNTTATIDCSITSEGASPITARGICWSTTINPTIANYKTTNSLNGATFIASITGLKPNTTYHVRAFATNSVDTSYSLDNTIITTSSTGLDENLLNRMYIYSNPTNGLITIKTCTESFIDNTIYISNIMGQKVYSTKLTTDKMIIDLSKYGPQGIYLVQIISENGIVIESRKIVLQ